MVPVVGWALLHPCMLKAGVVLDLQGANFKGSVWSDVSPAKNNAEIVREQVEMVKTPSGQPALDFGKSRAYLLLNEPLNGDALTTAPNFTIFLVVQLPSDAELTRPVQPILGGSQDGTMSYAIGPIEEGKSEVHQALGKERVDSVGIGAPVDSDSWHVLAVSYDGTNYGLYVDGSLKSSGEKSLVFERPISTFIGYNISENGVCFNGKIAALVIHDKALSQEETSDGSDELIKRYLSQ